MSKPSESRKPLLPALEAGNLVLQQDKELYETRAAANIERYIGTARIPIGLAGPVTVLGEHAKGTFHIPMATTEGTLVASTTRGMKVINACGGVKVRVVRNGGIQRAPVLEFDSIDDAYAFSLSLAADWSWLKTVMESTTRHGKLMDIRCWQMARMVCVRMTMDPGDASGQNMVSIAAQAGIEAMTERFPTIRAYRMGGGLSGEKVACSVNTLLGRGKAVAASVSIPGDVMRKITRAELADIPRLHQSYSNYALWAGNSTSHLSLAYALTALFIAAGQDVATLPESSSAQNIFDYDVANDVLHWDLHIPNINAGTVGGGTGLPTQRECLELMDCHGNGKVNKFIELCAVASLSNEISFWGAMCAQEWIRAHANLRKI